VQGVWQEFDCEVRPLRHGCLLRGGASGPALEDPQAHVCKVERNGTI